jgi:hypothetical protein
MRCKPSDLAIVLSMKNSGRIVRCVRLATGPELDRWSFVTDEGPVWVVDQMLEMSYGSPAPLCRDISLCPIRPSEGEDEVLRYAGRPNETPAGIIREKAHD